MDTPNNPLLQHDQLPPYDEITPAHVVPGIRTILEELLQRFEEHEKNMEPSWESAVRAVTRLEEPLSYAWGIVGHLISVRNSPELREAYEEVQPEVVDATLRISQSKPRFRALKELTESEGWNRLPEPQQRIVEIALRDAELSGVGLEGEKAERFSEIERELSSLATKFGNNLLDATKAYELWLRSKDEVDGLPENLLQRLAEAAGKKADERGEEMKPSTEEGPWLVTLDGPVFLPFMQHAKRRDLREKVHRDSMVLGSQGEFDNQPIIDSMLELRLERAKVLGYETHAQVSLARKMAPSVDAVDDFQEQLRQASFEKAQKEWKMLEEFARAELQDPGFELLHWDLYFWSERYREKHLDVSTEELRPYFPLQQVLDGLFEITQRLFGVRVVAAEGEARGWHPDVMFFKILDEAGDHIASFFFDPYSRPAEKRGGAWMNDLWGREAREDGSVRVPVAYLCCNQTPPTSDAPSLMTFGEVATLFHEFGHGVQHMLTAVDFPEAAGMNNLEWDAVEVCSMFMQEWVYDRDTVLGFARHYKTGDPLPEEKFDKLVAARTHLAGYGMLRQVFLGALDMELYQRFSPGGQETPNDRVQRISPQYSVIDPLPENRFICQFGHIFGGPYAAGYYSYKWAEVMSADAFAAFEEAGTDGDALAKTGRKFKETFLQLGSTRPPAEVFREFRGRDPQIEPLLRRYALL